MDDNLLYEIKSLEREIFRNFIKSSGFNDGKIPTPTQMLIVQHLLKNNGVTYQRDLEDVLNLRRATVSGVLQTMEKNGILERTVSEDRRVKKVILNKDAKKFFDNKKEIFERLEKKMILNVSEDDLKVFLKVLKQFKNNIEYNEK